MKHLPLYLMILLIAGCTAGNKNDTKTPASEQLLQQVVGTWLGELPCDDCDAVVWQLTLNADNTFSQERTHLGQNEQAETGTGTWHLYADSALTLADNNGETSLFFGGAYLEKLPAEKERSNAELREFYKLHRKTSETNPLIDLQKGAAGIDFRAIGNEPFWSLEIDFENNMVFETMDGFSITTSAVAPEEAFREDAVHYKAETKEGTLVIDIIRQPCTNNMSGDRSEYKVDLQVKSATDKTFKNYSGCGNYLGSSRVNGAWQLQRMGNSNMVQGGEQEIPNLNISLNQNIANGFSGCNRYTGKIERSGDSLTLSYVASTRMACPDDTLENHFLKAISEKTLPFRVNNYTLLLGSGDNVLVFDKMEE
jgi:heat shock protein HslJ